MAAAEEDVQAQLDELAALGEQRAELGAAAEERAEFLNDPAKEFTHGVQLGIANAAGVPVDIVNTMLNAVGMQADAPLGSGDNIQDVLAEMSNFPTDLPNEPTGPISGAGEGVGDALTHLLQ